MFQEIVVYLVIGMALLAAFSKLTGKSMFQKQKKQSGSFKSGLKYHHCESCGTDCVFRNKPGTQDTDCSYEEKK